MKLGYIRNSLSIQENSIDTQKKLIEDYCLMNGVVLDEIVIDEGISGSGDKVKDRGGYNSILSLIKEGKVEDLIVISLSRWGRNVGETYNSVRLMDKMNTKFISIKENIDTSSPVGRFTINILSSLFEMELELIRERTKDTLQFKKDNNKVYSPTPYGFDRDGDDLIENPKEIKLLRKMLRLRNDGMSYGLISKYLKRNKYKTKKGGDWTRQNVCNIIKNHQQYC
mgnify:CR=1 FL=1